MWIMLSFLHQPIGIAHGAVSAAPSLISLSLFFFFLCYRSPGDLEINDGSLCGRARGEDDSLVLMLSEE